MTQEAAGNTLPQGSQGLEVNKKGIGCDRTTGTPDSRRDRKCVGSERHVEAGTEHACKSLGKEIPTSTESHHVSPAEETVTSAGSDTSHCAKRNRSDAPKF